jgi:tetratricopeptide (TPR) repeat protein
VRDVPAIDVADADPEVANAITAARDAVVKKRTSAEAWGELALTLHAHNYLTEAAVCYAAAAELDPLNPHWPYLHGVILQNGPEPEAALPYLQRAADMCPPNSMPRLARADLLLDRGRLDEADAEFDRVLKAAPRDSHANLGKAQVAVARKEYKEALPYLQAVVDDLCARKHASALRVAALVQLNDTAGAETERERLATLPDDLPWPDVSKDRVAAAHVGEHARLQKAAGLMQHARVAEATAVLRDVVQRYPRSDQAWAALAGALSAGADKAGAEAAIHKSIELAKDPSKHWYYLGLMHKTQGNHQQAVEAFRQALKLRPTDAATFFELGDCLHNLGDRTGAADAFRQALRYRPEMEDARQRLAVLESK